MIYEKLLNIQIALKAPKSQRNEFGKYNYRNCEDILEAVKPLCKEQKTVLTIKDEIVNIESRFYVQAIATLTDIETAEQISVTASAREEETKKGMDGSQITGASSSYARKYALNGIFAIDDTKDSDTTNTDDKKMETTSKPETKKTELQQALETFAPGTKKMLGSLNDEQLRRLILKADEFPNEAKMAGVILDDRIPHEEA